MTEVKAEPGSVVGEAPAAALTNSVQAQPVGEKFFMSGRIKQEGGAIQITGQWEDIAGRVGADSKHSIDVVGFDLGSADLPPSGTYPGRLNLGSGAPSKRHQMNDKMALTFGRGEGEEVVVKGEGSNRVGAFTIQGTCTRGEEGAWTMRMERIYTPMARPPAPVVKSENKRLASASLDQPRRPRAAAPAKGAWGSQGKKESFEQQSKTPATTKKQKVKHQDEARHCVAVIFNGLESLSSVYRCPNVEVAKAKCDGLTPESEFAIRAVSDAGDGVLFPPVEPPAAKLPQAPIRSVPHHIIILDVATPHTGKARSWKPTVLGFPTARRAANYAIHCYKTCGPRLTSLEWHEFQSSLKGDAVVEAIPQCSLSGDGAYDKSLPVADYASLESAALS